jgi:lipoprotein-anchoring transpeptidase ErfK/SrfK
MRVPVLLAATAALAFAMPAVHAETAPAKPVEPASPAAAAPSPAAVADKVAAAATEAKVAAATPPAKPKAAAPATTLVAKINLSTQRLDVHFGGQLQHSWPISSGLPEFATPRGTFRPQWTAKMWFSRKYDDAPMPHSVFFNGGIAVHATNATRLLGQPASHGCIRLSPSNAAEFYRLVHAHGMKQTRIEVFGTPPAPRVASAPARREAPRMAASGARPQSPRAAAGAQPSLFNFGWGQPTAAPPRVTRQAVRQGPGGVIHLPPGSPLRGRQSFVLNGVTYVRVR